MTRIKFCENRFVLQLKAILVGSMTELCGVGNLLGDIVCARRCFNIPIRED